MVNTMVTLRDVAERAGVSPTTASAALRRLDIVKPETTRRVEQAASELNYRASLPAKMLRTGRTGVFTFAVPNLDTPFYAVLADRMSEEAERYGYRMVIRRTHFSAETERRVLGELATTYSDGVFMIATQLNTTDIKHLLRSRPAVLFEDFSMDGTFDSVNTPSADGMLTAIEHLRACGCERIGVVGGPYDPEASGQADCGLTARSRIDRLDSANRALQRLGLVDGSGFVDAEWSVDGGIAAAHALSEAGLPYDGLCCMNDDIALGVLRGLHECGVGVPGQVKVIGFDGIPQSRFSVPTLSTVAVDFAGAARSALTVMLRHFEDGPAALCQRITIGYRLIVHESTVGDGGTNQIV